MSQMQIVLFATLVLGAGTIVLMVFARYLRVERMHNRYRLFAIRDQLRIAAAEGIIETWKPTYRHLEGGLNLFIAHINELSITRLLTMTRDLGGDHKARSEFLKELAKEDPKIAEIAGAFYLTVSHILYQNDHLLRCILF